MKIDEKLDKELEKIRDDIKRINIDLKELRTSINRMEGAFYRKNCCIVKSFQDKKAQ